MLEPSSFDANDAWVVFRLNDAPLHTEADGDFDVLCIMDAASRYIFGNELMPVQSLEVPESAAARLIEAGRSQAQSLPHRLILASEFDLTGFTALADRLGVEVQWATEEELSPLTSQTRGNFQETMARRGER